MTTNVPALSGIGTDTGTSNSVLVPVPMYDDPTCAPAATIIRPMPETVMRLKAMADETRLTLLLTLLHAAAPVCVCNLLPGVGVGQATVSHHLKILRAAGLVAVERQGIWAHYRIAPDAEAWLRTMLD